MESYKNAPLVAPFDKTQKQVTLGDRFAEDYFGDYKTKSQLILPTTTTNMVKDKSELDNNM